MAGHRAGASAEDVAQRARAKAARLERWAKGWEAGAVGERATASVLAGLDPVLWTVVHDVRWPGRRRANLDHVVVGPAGVFVIDSKNWLGTVDVRDGVLRQNGRPREPAVVGAAEAALAVLRLVPDVPVHPVLCFVGEEPMRGWVRGVMLCSTATLREMLESRPAALRPEQVARVTATLLPALQPTTQQGGDHRRRHSHAATTKPRRPASRSSSGPSAKRLVGFLLMVGLMLAALQNGLPTAVLDQVVSFVVQVGTDDRDTADEPARRKNAGDRQKVKQREQGRQRP